jgi:hypothetical protein
MITCNLLGGLGNQLFQIFAVISYSIDCNNIPAFSDLEHTIGITRRYTYWNTLLIYLRKYIFLNLPSHLPILREKAFTYNELPIIKDLFDVRLVGYFQSYKYFEKNKTKILEMIQIESQKNQLRKQVKYDFYNTISIHFRIGDFQLLQDKHPILTKTYYQNAIRYILMNMSSEMKKKINILYFCETTDVIYVEQIIEELKTEFKEPTFTQINFAFKDWEQLLIMSCCRYNIIANSTFSWWGAYFNKHIEKIVCYPSKWFGPSLSHSTRDLFPEEWIKIKDI